MSGFIDNTSNIDAAEIAAEYRTPEQGVSAKSNSNVAWNDYKRMTPRANQASNAITTAGSQTMQAQDFGGTAGFTPANRTYQTGSAKGATIAYTYVDIGSPINDSLVAYRNHFGPIEECNVKNYNTLEHVGQVTQNYSTGGQDWPGV